MLQTACALMRAESPALHQRGNPVNARKELLGLLAILPNGRHVPRVALPVNAEVPEPVVGVDLRTGHNRLRDEGVQPLGGCDGMAAPGLGPEINPQYPALLALGDLPLLELDGGSSVTEALSPGGAWRPHGLAFLASRNSCFRRRNSVLPMRNTILRWVSPASEEESDHASPRTTQPRSSER